MSRPAEVARQLEHDFTFDVSPFDEVEFPEERLLREVDNSTEWRLTAEDKLAVVSLFATLDYNRNANQLVDKLLEAIDHSGVNILNPHEVSTAETAVQTIFDEIPTRYPSTDASGWVNNCCIIVDMYNGMWTEFLLSTNCDAPTLVERLESDDFKYLKGDKIAPMYARIIHDEVCHLTSIWETEIPVDAHIRRLSRDLFDSPDMDDDMIRREWRVLAQDAEIERHVVDGALWQIGNNWNEWGEDYWEEVTG